jgi:hypothetical protein
MAKLPKDRIFEGTKSPYNFEKMDSGSGGELAYAQRLETDPDVIAWTKKHNIVIRYRNAKGGISRYFPDFLVRRKNQSHLELVEIKGKHLRNDPNVDAKKKAAEDWCKQRGMTYKIIAV